MSTPHPAAPSLHAPPPAVCLLSGGMDSAVVLAEARAAGFAVHALSFRYGQRHAVELEAAARVARAGGALSHRVVDVDLRALGGSALTAAIEVPKDRAAAEIGRGVPATYVPARNTVFLALALAHAEVLGSTDLFVGVNAVDYSGYPDCRPEFLRAFAELANLATASGAERGGRFRIHAPLLELGKGQIVRRAAELGVDLALTHTCYDPQWGSGGPLACGRCDACLLRLQGFAAAGWPDPLPYATSPTAPHAAAQPRPFVELPASGDPRTDAVRRLVAIVERLRAPDGCPWDREQTLVSLAPLLLEEAHELVEALESADPAAALEEAGDVLLAVTLLCQVAEQEGHFDLGRAARAVGDKLLRRHPHVFGGGEQASGDAPLGERATTPLGAQETVQRWEEIKRAERAARRGGDRSVLAGVPQGLGAVQRAQRLGAKAMGTGFRWPDGRGALRKLREELAELEAALAAAGAGDAAAVPPPGAGRERVGQELGDVLLAVAQLANYLQFDAEAAGRAAARRFERRFRALEKEFGGDLAGRPLAELMAGWARAKRRTAAEAGGEGPAD